MPGFSTFYAYSTHKQKKFKGDRKSGNLNTYPRRIFLRKNWSHIFLQPRVLQFAYSFKDFYFRASGSLLSAIIYSSGGSQIDVKRMSDTF